MHPTTTTTIIPRLGSILSTGKWTQSRHNRRSVTARSIQVDKACSNQRDQTLRLLSFWQASRRWTVVKGETAGPAAAGEEGLYTLSNEHATVRASLWEDWSRRRWT